MRLLIATSLAIAAAACSTVRNPATCDATHPCVSSSLPYCNLQTERCEASAPGDMACAASTCTHPTDGFDGGGCESGCADMSHADMTPMCTVATVATSCTTAAMPICDATAQTCRACNTSADDAQCAAHANGKDHCNTTSHVCVECNLNADCTTATKPICDTTTNTCRACAVNNECSSLGTWPEGGATGGICKGDGSCASASEVAFVDNRGGVAACTGLHAAATGTANDPYCDISTAVSGAKPFALVEGQGTMVMPAPYGALTINNRNIAIVGPGKTAMPLATISPTLTTTDAVSISGTSSVQLVGVEITAAAGTHNGITCTSGTTLTVKDCTIHNNGGTGISATGTNFAADANYVWSNSNGGIAVGTGSTYTITNNLIYGDGTGTLPGVSFTGVAPGVFAFNTIAKNHIGAGAGGIDCGGGAMLPIVNSIVWGNDLDSVTHTQLGPKCMLTSVVTGTADNQGTMLDPVFVGASDFHLQPNNAANDSCCIDKIATPGTANAGHDVDLAKRPQGATGKWTIGANERAQ